jgi:Fe-S-cluster containining protein
MLSLVKLSKVTDFLIELAQTLHDEQLLVNNSAVISICRRAYETYGDRYVRLVDLTGRFTPKLILNRDDSFWFKCDMDGECCRRPEYVSLTKYELEIISGALNMSKVDVACNYCAWRDGTLVLKRKTDGDCVFLNRRDKKAYCVINKVKPFSCLSFPITKIEKETVELTLCNGTFNTYNGEKIKVDDWIRKYNLEKRMEIQNEFAYKITTLPADFRFQPLSRVLETVKVLYEL